MLFGPKITNIVNEFTQLIVTTIFREYRVFLDSQMQTNLALSASMSSFEVFGNINNQLPSGISAKENDHVLSKVVLDEADLYTNLFCPLLEELGNSRSNLKRIISFILEYIRSLEEEQIPVQHFLNELLINLLVQNGSWYQLHQLLQYHVIVDSKPLGIFFGSTYKLMYIHKQTLMINVAKK